MLRIWQETTSRNAVFPDTLRMITDTENRAWIDRAMGYTRDIELKMQRLFASLSEKDRRRYAAIEVLKLTHGGLEYICVLFKIDGKTVRQRLTELELAEEPAASRARKKGRTQVPDPERYDASVEFPQNFGGIHSRRLDARRCFVDQFIQTRDQQAFG